MPSSNYVPQLRDDLEVREIDGDAVVLDQTNDRMHTLNASAACIFRAINGQRDIATICEALTEEFDVPLERAEADVSSVLEEFERLGLLQGVVA